MGCERSTTYMTVASASAGSHTHASAGCSTARGGVHARLLAGPIVVGVSGTGVGGVGVAEPAVVVVVVTGVAVVLRAECRVCSIRASAGGVVRTVLTSRLTLMISNLTGVGMIYLVLVSEKRHVE